MSQSKESTAQQDLQELQTLLKLALYAADAGVWAWEMTTGEVFWIDNYHILWEDPELHWIDAGTHFSSHDDWLLTIHRDDRERTGREMKEAVEKRRGMNLVFRVLRFDGALRWMRARGQIIYDDKEQPIRVVGISLDVTTRMSRKTDSETKPRACNSEQTPAPHDFNILKERLYHEVINHPDLSNIDQFTPERIQTEVEILAKGLIVAENTPLTSEEQERLIDDVRHRIFMFGPLAPLFADLTISDILVNSSTDVYVERRGRLSKADVKFKDADHLMSTIERIASFAGRRINKSSPIFDVRYPDGSIITAIIPPLAVHSPNLSIRRFGSEPLQIKDLVNLGVLTVEMVQLLEACVKGRLNILISGGTGAGRITLLNCLSSFIYHDERIITIEEFPDLLLQHPHVIVLSVRVPNIEEPGEVIDRDLLRKALRMRPDRLIISDLRYVEVPDLLDAMRSGYDGALTTIHADTPQDALARLETMIQIRNTRLPDHTIRQQISSAIDVIIQLSRLGDGSRRITSISEPVGMEGELIDMQEIFKFARHGVSPRGEVIGQHRPTGVRPKFITRLEMYGFTFPPSLFDEKS